MIETKRSLTNCPVCNSRSVRDCGKSINLKYHKKEVECLSCGTRWVELFEMVGYYIIEYGFLIVDKTLGRGIQIMVF